MARQWERVDEDTAVRPRFGLDPPPSFVLSANSGVHLPTMDARPPTLGGDLIVAEELAGEMTAPRRKPDWQQRSSWTMRRSMGVGLVVEELDRCWEVTQDQDKAAKIEKTLNETQMDVKTETTFMSYVARRKINFQQLENALGKICQQ